MPLCSSLSRIKKWWTLRSWRTTRLPFKVTMLASVAWAPPGEKPERWARNNRVSSHWPVLSRASSFLSKIYFSYVFSLGEGRVWEGGELWPQEDTDACRVQKRASELQYLTWVLGTDLGSSVDTLWNPNCWAISAASRIPFLLTLFFGGGHTAVLKRRLCLRSHLLPICMMHGTLQIRSSSE